MPRGETCRRESDLMVRSQRVNSWLRLSQQRPEANKLPERKPSEEDKKRHENHYSDVRSSCHDLRADRGHPGTRQRRRERDAGEKAREEAREEGRRHDGETGGHAFSRRQSPRRKVGRR